MRVRTEKPADPKTGRERIARGAPRNEPARWLWFWPIVALVSGIPGCSQGPEYEYGTVAGTVTIDNQPVPRGSITFRPQDGNAGPVTGCPIVDGRFHCDLVPIGKQTVTFIAQAAELQKVTDATGVERQIPQDLLPAQYAPGVPCDVAAGEQTHDFALRSQ